MVPLLVACGASVTLVSSARGKRAVPLSAFLLGYRKVDLGEADASHIALLDEFTH